LTKPKDRANGSTKTTQVQNTGAYTGKPSHSLTYSYAGNIRSLFPTFNGSRERTSSSLRVWS